MADIPFAVKNEYYADPAPRPLIVATAGGQGAFSYLDTKVYGPRQQRQMYQGYRQWYDDVTGVPLDTVQPLGPKGLILPGTGGSAKAPGKRYFGSRAVGFSPNGLVLIRLIKI